MQPQNNYDFIMNDASHKKAGFSQKQRIMQAVRGLVVLIVIFGGLYALLFAGNKDDSQKLLPVYGSLLDIKDLSDLASKELKNADKLNQATTNSILAGSQMNDLNKFVDKKTVANKKTMALYRNSDHIKALEEAKSNGNYEKSYNAILANRLDAHKQLIVTAYSSTGNNSIKILLEELGSQLNTANGAQILP
jgi:hypothetical protein